jgi:hypothetical protein
MSNTILNTNHKQNSLTSSLVTYGSGRNLSSNSTVTAGVISSAMALTLLLSSVTNLKQDPFVKNKYQDTSTALDTHIKSKKTLSLLEARQLILAEMKKAEEERRYLSYKEYEDIFFTDES